MSMCESDRLLANRIGDVCMTTYNSLGKKGKPGKGREWTKMACIVKSDGEDAIEVLTLATGTKCIGENSRNNRGSVLNDSHAEILARRLFLKYLFRQLELSCEASKESIFHKCQETQLYTLKKNVKFHLFTTDIPCGDASIFPRDGVFANIDDGNATKRKYVDPATNVKRRKDCDGDVGSAKIVCDEIPRRENSDDHDAAYSGKVVNHGIKEKYFTAVVDNKETLSKNGLFQVECVSDIHRTGAKCVPQGEQDLLEPGVSYHQTGALRIKPGRGERTLSMSCSDKIMKWCVLGITGGLLANFLKEQIFLSSVIISSNEFEHASVIRALSLRGRNIHNKLKLHLPKILSSKVKFVDGVEAIDKYSNHQNGRRITPAGTAILWCKVCSVYEVSVVGRKHGITKKDMNSSKASTSICKKNLFGDFKRFLEISGNSTSFQDSLTYYECKHACKGYEKMRDDFFKMFPDWTKKCKHEEEFVWDNIR